MIKLYEEVVPLLLPRMKINGMSIMGLDSALMTDGVTCSTRRVELVATYSSANIGQMEQWKYCYLLSVIESKLDGMVGMYIIQEEKSKV